MSNPDSFWNHPIEKLEKALQIRKQIAALQDALGKVFGGATQPAAAPKTSPKRKGKRTMSPEARAKIAAAQKTRWAKIKKRKPATAPVPAKAAPAAKTRKKGGMSAEGRARVAAAQKARWAKVRKGKSKQIAGRRKIAAEGQPSFRVL